MFCHGPHFWSALFPPALLPGLKLRHDRVLCAHDLERPHCPQRQREPHRGGAEVGPAAVQLLSHTQGPRGRPKLTVSLG